MAVVVANEFGDRLGDGIRAGGIGAIGRVKNRGVTSELQSLSEVGPLGQRAPVRRSIWSSLSIFTSAGFSAATMARTTARAAGSLPARSVRASSARFGRGVAFGGDDDDAARGRVIAWRGERMAGDPFDVAWMRDGGVAVPVDDQIACGRRLRRGVDVAAPRVWIAAWFWLRPLASVGSIVAPRRSASAAAALGVDQPSLTSPLLPSPQPSPLY